MGTILPYIGALDALPYGWFLCDGSNGTPDLRDRFLTGAGSAYVVGAIGGESFHQLTIEEMPSHSHSYFFLTPEVPSWNDNYNVGSAVNDAMRNLHRQINWQNTNPSGGNQPHENRPPFYAVYYIIRLK